MRRPRAAFICSAEQSVSVKFGKHRSIIHTFNAMIKSKARVVFKLLGTLFRDVPGATVHQPHCTRGEPKCVVERMAREEDLADIVVAREETLGTLDKEPLVEPPSSIGAFRIDGVLVRDTQDVPDSRDLGMVALLIEASMHHLEPELPRARVIVAQLRGAMRGLV